MVKIAKGVDVVINNWRNERELPKTMQKRAGERL
jgi:hypothetical protein